MEKTDYDFGNVKQKILREARRLVVTYQINTAHHCIRDLCELEEYVHRLKTYPGNDCYSGRRLHWSLPEF